MKVCVMGLWHLGSVTSACLASVGHDVIGLDFNQRTADGLNAGKAPLFEPGLDDLIQQGLSTGRLRFESNPQSASSAEVLWVAYDTPVDDEDRADTAFVVAQIETVMPFLQRRATILVSSQMPVGSIRNLEAMAKVKHSDLNLGFAYSPENLRLGKALDIFLRPDRIVVGTRTVKDRDRLSELFRPVTDRVEWMSVESAEMTKHAINAFLATSVTFANEIATICECVGADAKEVERGLKTEHRIGPKAYLSPGGAFAGGTLARDVNFLNQVGSEKGLQTPLLLSVKPSNDGHKHWDRRRLLAQCPQLSGQTVSIWGLTYKPGTNTLRRSLAVELCNWLLEQGAHLRVHDPAVEALPKDWENRVVHCDTPLDAIKGCFALVVATEWPLYQEVLPEAMVTTTPGLMVLDANRFLNKLGEIEGIDYMAVGTPHGGS